VPSTYEDGATFAVTDAGARSVVYKTVDRPALCPWDAGDREAPGGAAGDAR
jgi:hypothetical protein